MYNPFIKCVAQMDRLGNLQIWLGDNIQHPKPKYDEEVAYIQTSQERSDIYANCFDFTDSDLEELENGWAVVIQLHEDYYSDMFSQRKAFTMISKVMDIIISLPQHNYIVALGLPGFYFIHCDNFDAYDALTCELWGLDQHMNRHSIRNYVNKQFAILIDKE